MQNSQVEGEKNILTSGASFHPSKLCNQCGVVLQLFMGISKKYTPDSRKNSSERAKCKVMISKMSSWLFVAEVAMLKDALYDSCLISHIISKTRKQISWRLTAEFLMPTTFFVVSKKRNGKSTQRFIDSFTAPGTFKYVQLNKNECDEG